MKDKMQLRNGVTVIEVLFAMGIAVIGLLGIASLIPLASRNAGESIRAAEAQALAEDWYNELITRGLHLPSSWTFYSDFTFNNGTVSVTPGYFAYSSSLPPLRTPSLNRNVARQAVCIDPLFFSSREAGQAINDGAFSSLAAANHRWYRPAVFPYYLDTHNPVVDPAYNYNAGSEILAKPRMVRVTPGATSVALNSAFYKSVFASSDDYSVFADRSDLAARPTRVANGSKLLSKGEYSWIATICPTDTTTSGAASESALLSVAVIHRRDTRFFHPTSSTLPPPPPPRNGDPDTENKPSGERCFRVVASTGTFTTYDNFKGGHGGRVRIYGSDGVDSTMHTGEWLLLAKNVSTTLARFRWYRIVAMESEAVYDSATLGSTDPVWYRDIVLDGPDRDFTPAILVPAPAQPDFTTAIYIPCTVAVHERIIQAF